MNSQKILCLFLAICIAIWQPANAQKSSAKTKPRELKALIAKNFIDAAAQYKVMMKNVSEDRFPKTFDPGTGKFETSNSGWWCSGFYPGTLLYLFEETKDTLLYREAIRVLKHLEKEQFNKNTHDKFNYGNLLQNPKFLFGENC